MKHLACLLLLVAAVLAADIVHSTAQETLKPGDGETVQTQAPVEVEKSDPGSWSGFLDSTDQALAREGLDEQQLEEFFDEAERIIQEAGAKILELQPQTDRLTQQLDELGPKPEAGEPPEAPEVTGQRKSVNEQFAEMDRGLKEAKLALVRATQIQKYVAGERRKRFVGSISSRSTDALGPAFWGRFFSDFKGFSKSLGLLFKDSYAVLVNRLGEDNWKKLGLPAFLAGVLLILLYLRRLLAAIAASFRFPGISRETNNPVQAFFDYCRNGLFVALVPIVIYQVFSRLDLLTPRLDQFSSQIAFSIAFLITAISLARVVLSPANAPARIAHLSDPAAAQIFRLMTGGLGVATILHILNNVSVILASPFEVSFGLSFLLILVVSGTAFGALVLAARERAASAAPHGAGIRLISWYYFRLIAWLIAIVAIAAAIAGYVALAEFLSLQLIFGFVVIGTLWLMLRVLETLYQNTLKETVVDDDGTATASGIISHKQFGVLGFGLLKMMVYLAAGLLLLLPWGYQTSDFLIIIKKAFFGFNIGGLSISLSTLMLAFGLFLVGYTITIALRNWLNNRLLPTTQLDIGLSNSISTIFGYIGFILAAVLAISAAGFDLSNLAIVAGALSLGIGFGLQSIVNNFVSGLILLTERPIKAGDWVLTTGGEGTVKRISVRSTEIETFDRATIIVPNSTLISDTVTNWTHTSKLGRIIIPVGVSYDSDPDQVREILLKIAREEEGILRKPEPVVYFMDFGSSSLDFQLRAFLSDINYSISIQSELRFKILKALRQAKIEIPFPQRDIHLKTGDVAAMTKPAGGRKRTPK